MSNPFYKLLETFDELEEATQKVKTIGNAVEVDDGKGNKIQYDKATWDEMQGADDDSVGVTEDGVNEAGYYGSRDERNDWNTGERERNDFKRQEQNAGLEDEEYTWNQQPWAVCFNGKPWKTFKGKQAAQNVGQSMANKGKTGITIRPAKTNESMNEGYGDDYETDNDFVDLGPVSDTLYTDNEYDIDDTGFDLDDDDVGMDFNFESDDFELDDAVIDDNLYSDSDYSSGYDNGGWGDELGDDDVGIDFSFEDAVSDEEDIARGEVDFDDDFIPNDDSGSEYEASEYDDDDFDEPEYERFDLKMHGKRLRPGTPVIFSDDIGGGKGIFIEKSPSGAFGTAERNGKTISIHLNDIEEADLQNSAIYENFDKKFSKVMEEISVTRTSNATEPENDTITITGTAEHADTLGAMMKLAGMDGGAEGEAQGELVLPQDAEIPVNIEPEMGPGMADMMSMVDTAEQPPISGAEEMESIREEENDDEEELEEDYSNEPNDADELASDVEGMVNGRSGGLNKQKKQYDKGYEGDNVMTAKIDESDSFLNLYKKIRTLDNAS